MSLHYDPDHPGCLLEDDGSVALTLDCPNHPSDAVRNALTRSIVNALNATSSFGPDPVRTVVEVRHALHEAELHLPYVASVLETKGAPGAARTIQDLLDALKKARARLG